MAEVTTRLLRWRPAQGEQYTVDLVTDDADFDTDPVTGVHYDRILRAVVNCNTQRGATFQFGARNLLKLPRTLTGTQTNRTFSLAQRRTTEDFNWDFTPDHVDIVPGSVSNPALLTSGGDATASATDVTAAFTPTASALLVVGWTAATKDDGIPGTFTFSNSHAGSGAWAQPTNATLDTVENDGRHSQARCQMGASPGSGTVTCTNGTPNPEFATWIVAEITGHDTTTPLSESNTGTSEATTLTITLASVAAGNMAVSSVGSQETTAIGVGTGETEVAEATSGGTNYMRTQMQYGTTVTQNWTTLGDKCNVGVAIEYAQDAGGAPAFDLDRIERYYGRGYARGYARGMG